MDKSEDRKDDKERPKEDEHLYPLCIFCRGPIWRMHLDFSFRSSNPNNVCDSCVDDIRHGLFRPRI